MKAGILAAGQGERLRTGGYVLPKALIPIGGVPLIGHILSALQHVRVEEAICIINEESQQVLTYCQQRDWGMPVTVVTKTTANSFASFLTIYPHLADAPSLLLMVDSVFPAPVLSRLVNFVAHVPEADGVLGVTPFIDDEKPVWVESENDGRIRALGESVSQRTLVTAGIYYVTPAIRPAVEEARQLRFTALRQFLEYLVSQDYRLYAYQMRKVVDVDRPADIQAAEALLAESKEG